METFTDPRDGNSYRIIKINNLYWFAENLRYQGVPHYFPDRNSDNLHEYGLLYTWISAKFACPAGWRLPTMDDFKQLLTVAEVSDNSSILHTPSRKNSSNPSKFTVLRAGYKNARGHYHYSFGCFTSFWSATLKNSTLSYSLDVSYDNVYVYYNHINYALSIRCVKEI